MSFVNKVVLITGASSGIGAAVAIAFAKEGANLSLVGRNQEKLKSVADHCSQIGNTPLAITGDVSKDDDILRIVKETIDRYGKLDVLVNNAGIGTKGNITNGKIVGAYDEIMRVNVRAVIQLTTLTAPYLIQTKGNVVNVSSIVGKSIKTTEFLAYNVSKAALDHFTRGAALEMAASGVRVNAISPGPVRTGFFDAAKISVSPDILASVVPLKRICESEEIADLILFLASDKAKGITGSDFVSDNGFLLT